MKRCHFLGFPYIAAGAPDLRHGRIALLLRAWPFSVAPRPLARRSGPADTLSARPDLMQGPGALLPPPGCPPLQNVPGSGGLRLGFRASCASVGRGGSPADALCGKRLRLPALRSWRWTTASGGRSGRYPRWP